MSFSPPFAFSEVFYGSTLSSHFLFEVFLLLRLATVVNIILRLVSEHLKSKCVLISIIGYRLPQE